MTATEFRAALADRRLTVTGAAKIFNINIRTVRRWISGEQNVPASVALALKLMIWFNVDPRTL